MLARVLGAAAAAQDVASVALERVEDGAARTVGRVGVLAGAEALPFPRAAFEAAIRGGGRGAEASLRAFAAAYDAARAVPAPAVAIAAKPKSTLSPRGPEVLMTDWSKLAARVTALPALVAEMALPGLKKVIEFQDLGYGADYLAWIEAIVETDDPARGHLFSREAAKYIANAFTYDDVIRVADIKTRSSRFARIRGEMGATDDNLVNVTVPVLYIGADGGFGTSGLFSTTLLGSTDKETLIVDLTPDQLHDFGHSDLFLGIGAQTLVWEPLLDWLHGVRTQ